jgi:transcription antitermination factor NusG
MQERRLEAMTTSGIFCKVSMRGKAVTIPQSEIESVRKAIEWGNRVKPHRFLRCGDRVRVTFGPLQGLEGILVRQNNVHRLALSVEILERSAAVEVDVSAVERVRSRRLLWPWGEGTYSPAKDTTVGRSTPPALV